MTDETATLSLAPSLDPPCSLFAFALSLARSILFPISHQLCFAFSLAFSSPFFRRMHLFARTHTILPTTNEMERKGGKGKGIEASSLSLSLSPVAATKRSSLVYHTPRSFGADVCRRMLQLPSDSRVQLSTYLDGRCINLDRLIDPGNRSYACTPLRRYYVRVGTTFFLGTDSDGGKFGKKDAETEETDIERGGQRA